MRKKYTDRNNNVIDKLFKFCNVYEGDDYVYIEIVMDDNMG